jgi:glycosyltransferase involved in cell wall biosynthesis
MLRLAKSVFARLRRSLRGPVSLPSAPISILSDGADWALDRMALEICDTLNEDRPGICAMVPSVPHLRGCVAHFMSRNLWLGRGHVLPPGNLAVVTCLHGVPDDSPAMAKEIYGFLDSLPRVARIVTTNNTIKSRLIGWGVRPDDVVVLPHGADRRLFFPVSKAEKIEMKQALGLPPGLPCIGSFQKDGQGWGDGMEPKHVKGPDLFLSALEKMHRHAQFSVLLTGPARGYVKAGLERLNIPYSHHWCSRFEEVATCYRALDLYLISSRDEGGPVALMEAMASGVPIVATPVGMVPDVLRHGENGLMGEPENAYVLANLATELLTNHELRLRLSEASVSTAADYDHRLIVDRYFNDVFQPLLLRLE